MKQLLLTAVCCFTAFSSFAQINFEPGYILDNNGNRNSVLIKNVEWRNNPSMIEYKTSRNSEVMTASVKDIQEFGIGESLKYRRQTVQLDQSGDNLKSLSRTRNPEFKEETVFLKVLLEGQADLYQFTDHARNRFLFSVNDGPVEQLVFKQYQSSTGNRRGRNNQFRQQLLNNLTCSGLGLNDVERLNYSESALRSFFVEYNQCSGSGSVIFEKEGAKGRLNFKIKAGVDLIDLKIKKEEVYYQIGRNIQFEDDINPRLGVELEYILPFNKNKWAVYTDPSYQQFSLEGVLSYNHSIPYDKPNADITSRSVAIPLGLRHYFYLGDNSGLFLNGAYAFNYYFKNELSSTNDRILEEVEFTNKSHSLDFGFGFDYKKKYSLEAKYGSGRDIFSDYSLWKSGGSSVYSLILGYTIF